MTKPFELHDFDTAVWRKVEARLSGLLSKDREQLEGPGLDEKPTSLIRLRARIALLKDLLNIPAEVRAEAEKAARART